jgi:hypothetical protein
VWLLHVAARQSCVKNGSQTPPGAPFLGQCLTANTIQTAHLKSSKTSYHQLCLSDFSKSTAFCNFTLQVIGFVSFRALD